MHQGHSQIRGRTRRQAVKVRNLKQIQTEDRSNVLVVHFSITLHYYLVSFVEHH